MRGSISIHDVVEIHVAKIANAGGTYWRKILIKSKDDYLDIPFEISCFGNEEDLKVTSYTDKIIL